MLIFFYNFIKKFQIINFNHKSMKTNKLLFFLITFVILSVSGFSQISRGSKDLIKQFMASETYFVEDLTRNSYNNQVDKVLDSIWSITSADIMTPEDFEKQMNNKSFSFIYLSTNTFKEDTSKQTFLCMNVTVGSKAKKISKLPDLGSFPIGYENIEEDEYLYKVGGLIRMVENHIKICEENPNLKEEEMLKEYNKDLKNVCTQEIWFLKEDLDEKVNTLDKIKILYPFPVKIATKEEIENAIFTSNPNVLFLHKAGPEGRVIGKKCWKFLIDAATGEVKYLNISKIDKTNDNLFLLSDFKKLPKKLPTVKKPAKPKKVATDEEPKGKKRTKK